MVSACGGFIAAVLANVSGGGGGGGGGGDSWWWGLMGNVVARVDTRGDGNVRPARVQFGDGRSRGPC